jgi:hypothetical protein
MKARKEQATGRRRGVARLATAAVAVGALSALLVGPANAHDTSYCGHSDITIGGWNVTLTGSEWVGSNHYHYYRHTSGPNAHTETNLCNSAH